ncbi:MAG: hypothetical protein U1F43_09755 [Myxococcota bacterium]
MPAPRPRPGARPSRGHAGRRAHAAAAGAPDEATLAATALLGEQDLDAPSVGALYVPATKTAYFTESWSEEGTGIGRALVIVDATGHEERSEYQTPSMDDVEQAAGVTAAQEALATRLRGQAIVRLTGHAWPVVGDSTKASASMALPELDASLEFKKGKLRALDAKGKKLVEVDVGKDAERPHKPSPARVSYLAGSDVVLVDVAFDPGEGYSDGFNVYYKTYLLRLR